MSLVVNQGIFHVTWNIKLDINMKGLKIVVLAKQVPDTRNVGKDAMKADGTVNRAALPAIFNPEDLNALEQALRLKDTIEGTTVHVLTMGPGPRSSERRCTGVRMAVTCCRIGHLPVLTR